MFDELGFSGNKNLVQTRKKNPFHQTQNFKPENFKNQVQIDRGFAILLSGARIVVFVCYKTHCSRITRYVSFISQDFFHFSTFTHNGDNLNL